MRSPPKPRAVAQFGVEGRHKGKTLHRQGSSQFEFDVAPGPAHVTISHGIKHWGGDAEGGMSIESSCEISLSCAQELKTILCANDTASDLAYKLAHKNADKLRQDLMRLVGGQDEEDQRTA